MPDTPDQHLTETPPPPRVFISYSHDSPQHRQWVAKLAGQLVEKGIEVILDQWDVSLGADLSSFMERGLKTADRVLVVCTPSYCKKANDGKGGVGYEKLIVTQDLMRNTQTDKFVPIIRVAESDPTTVVPTCLGTRLFIDMRDGQPDRFEDLTRDIHRQPPVSKPPLGKNPFAQTATGAPISAPPTPGTILPTVASNLDPVAIYEQAIQMARSKDFIGWRHLARDVRSKSLTALITCRSELDRLIDSGAVRQTSDVTKLLDAGMSTVAPMFAMALAGVESGLPEIERQEAVLDEVVNVAGWNQAGYELITSFPINLGFMYHYLHGAMAMQVGRLDLAMGLAWSSFSHPQYPHQSSVCKSHDLMGWTPVFRSHVDNSWRYLQDYVRRSPWLHRCFGSGPDLLIAIAAYGYALTLDECSDIVRAEIAGDPNWNPEPDAFKEFRPTTPLYFTVDDQPAPQRGYQLFQRNRSTIPAIWERHRVTGEAVSRAWEPWIRGSISWLGRVNYHTIFFDRSGLPHGRLMVDLGLAKNPPDFRRE